MERKTLVEEVKQYFVDSDHWRRLCAALQGDPDPEGSHVHAYVEMSIHPDSLEAIITGYFERMGWPSTRKIDHMAPKAGREAFMVLNLRENHTSIFSGSSTRMWV